jgi:hypothetical protein
MSIDGRILTAGAMVFIFVAMVGIALTYAPGARTLPLVIGIPGLVFALIQFASEWREKNPRHIEPEQRQREIAMFGWFVVFVVGLLAFGFIYAGPVLLALYLWFSWRERWYTILISAFLLWFILYFVFQRTLGLFLFDGLVTQWLFY